MSIERVAERLFSMEEEVWLRHANPWSVWTRYPCLPLLCLAVWSRDWIGWYCLLPVTLICCWIWLNPRVFSKPVSTDNWASKAVLGERVLLNEPKADIPQHHLKMIRVLKGLMTLGAIATFTGLFLLDFVLTLFGVTLTIVCKTWFLDRMVWLYQDLGDSNSQYRSWLY